MKRLLQALGFPTTNERGHELGCTCELCMGDRARRLHEPPKPGTLGHLFVELHRERKETLMEAPIDRIEPIRAAERAGVEHGDYARTLIKQALLELTDPGKTEAERQLAAEACAEAMTLIATYQAGVVVEQRAEDAAKFGCKCPWCMASEQ